MPSYLSRTESRTHRPSGNSARLECFRADAAGSTTGWIEPPATILRHCSRATAWATSLRSGISSRSGTKTLEVASRSAGAAPACAGYAGAWISSGAALLLWMLTTAALIAVALAVTTDSDHGRCIESVAAVCTSPAPEHSSDATSHDTATGQAP